MVKSATEVVGQLVWGTTKTYERRSVRLPRFLREQLAAYLADRPHAPHDLVFTMPQGRLLGTRRVPTARRPASAKAKRQGQ